MCSLTEHKVQFHFHEVFRSINEPSKNYKKQKKIHFLISVYPVPNIETKMNLVYKRSLEQNTYGFYINCTSFVMNTVIRV